MLYIVYLERYILDSDISNIIKTMFQGSNISVGGLDLCADKIQRLEAYIPGYCPYSRKTNERTTRILANVLRSTDISRSGKLDVREIVNVTFINKTVSIPKVPTRLRSPSFELTGLYFRSDLYHFGHMGWQKISLGPIASQKCLIPICSFNSIL